MRWFVSVVAALILAWLLYIASPYWALYRLATALERRDVAEISERINGRALRLSLARQIASELASSAGVSGLASQEAQLAASTALALADPFFAELTTPANLSGLLMKGPSGTPHGAPFGDDAVDLGDLDDFLGASSWRGFRNVYVALPPGEPALTRFRLQLRFGRLRWRLVALDLPAALRKRIATELTKRLHPKS